MAPNDKRVQVRIEVGHQSVCRSQRTEDGFTHDWSIFVRGAEGADISHFVEKVVFILHESFPKPKRVLKEPPYKVAESGYGSFNLPVEIYFRNKEDPRKYRLDYDLFLQLVGMPPVSNTKVEALTFLNPSEEFEQKLLKGGAVVLSADTGSVFSPPVKREPSTSPAANSSPVSLKKLPQASVLPSGKSRIKEPETNSSLVLQAKRSASDLSSIPNGKKKKSEKSGESLDCTPKYLKEVSVLSPTTDNAKSKTPSKDKKEKHKDFRDRRKVTDGLPAHADSGISAAMGVKGIKDSNLRPMDDKAKCVKQEKKLGLDKEVILPVEQEKGYASPEHPSEGSDLPRWRKITVKRTSTDAWSSVNQKPSSASDFGSPTLKSLNDNRSLIISNSSSENNSDVLENAERGIKGFQHSAGEEDCSSLDEDISSTRELLVASRTRDPNFSSNYAAVDLPISDAPSARDAKLKSSVVVASKVQRSKLPRSRKTGKTMPDGNTPPHPDELVELYQKLTRIQDPEKLQRIVDIVETSGVFEVTSSTFDFDLCCMDEETVQQIRDCL